MRFQRDAARARRLRAASLLSILLFMSSWSIAAAQPLRPTPSLADALRNPALEEALAEYGREMSAEKLAALETPLAEAAYIIPVMLDELPAATPDPDGWSQVEAGARLPIVAATTPDGKLALPLFTSTRAMSLWTKRSVGAMVLPAPQVWKMLEVHTELDGAVVNPGSEVSLPLSRATIDWLASRPEPTDATTPAPQTTPTP